jgi:hypothetical protein
MLDRPHGSLACVNLHSFCFVDSLVSIASLRHFNRCVEVLTLGLMMDVVESTSGHMPLLLPIFCGNVVSFRGHFSILGAPSVSMEILVRQTRVSC